MLTINFQTKEINKYLYIYSLIIQLFNNVTTRIKFTMRTHDPQCFKIIKAH